MPALPRDVDWDLEDPGSRFTLRPAFALLVPEQEWPDTTSDEVTRALVERELGAWVLEADEQIGQARVVQGGVGRGASGWAPVVEWLLEPAAHGIVGTAAAAAVYKVWRRVRRGDDAKGEEPPAQPSPRSLFVSRGMAVLLAASAISRDFDDEGPLQLEAAEEPSEIAGNTTDELNYVGLEPWVVLLRNPDTLRRYFVVIAPTGDVLGCIQTRMHEWETHYFYLPPPEGE